MRASEKSTRQYSNRGLPRWIPRKRKLTRKTLQEGYKEHLSQLNLLERTYEVDMRTEKPEFDSWSGKQKVQGYQITALGRLLLREIALGLAPDA